MKDMVDEDEILKWLEYNGISKKDANIRLTKLRRDNKGYVLLSNNNYVPSKLDVEDYEAVNSWIMLPEKTMAIIKNLPVSNHSADFIHNMSEEHKNLLKYNNIVLPFVGKEVFGIDTAEYFLVKFTPEPQSISVIPGQEYILTLDKRRTGEINWEGWDILVKTQIQDTNSISERIRAITGFLKANKVHEHTIYEVKDEFIRQEIFKKFIGYVDNHNGNWSIGMLGKSARAFPVYDFDICCGIQKPYANITVSDNGRTDLKSLIEQYRGLLWIKTYLKEIISTFDMNTIFEKSYERTKVQIPLKQKLYYRDYFQARIAELKAIYNEVFLGIIQGDEEQRTN